MRKLLALSMTVVAGLLVIPLAAQAGPTTCPTSGAICIDESVEGAAFPTVTGQPAGSIVGISQQTPTVGEEWAFVISVPFSAVSAEVSARSLGLLEPGSQALSDGIANVSIDIQEADLIMTSTCSPTMILVRSGLWDLFLIPLRGRDFSTSARHFLCN